MIGSASESSVADRLNVSSAAVTASACLIVLSHASGAGAVEGVLTDRGSGQAHPVALPWRAPLAAVVQRVAAVLAILPGQAHLAVSAGTARFEIRDGQPVVTAPDVHSGQLFAARLAPVLAAMRDNAEQPAGLATLWSAEDERIVASAHTPGAARTGTLVELVRERIRRLGRAVAVEDRDGPVTYARLGELVRGYAQSFADQGVGTGDVVGVGLPRRVELVATLLAIWEVGAAFLPLDLAHPRLRLEAALAGADARFTVLPGQPELTGCRVLDPSVAGASASAPTTGVPAPTDLAYAMSTSGSTGRPKVVGVTHGALFHIVTTSAGLLGVHAPRVAATTGLTFDISLLELFLPLATGGRLLLADEETRRDPVRLAGWLSRQRPDIAQATPSTWRMALPYLKNGLGGTVLLCGGEALTADLAAGLAGTGADVWNVYGPTEATLWCITGRVPAPYTDPVPIGRPVPGTVAAVLDVQGRPVPVGQVGELYLGGAQLAVGYLGDPARTAAAFVDTQAIGPAYRTGDLAAWRTDGMLVFHGCADNQVKLRGQRVELEEIEAYAERHPGVARAAAVLVEYGSGDQRLFLYYQAQSGMAVTGAELRAHLHRWLPVALLPQRVTALAQLPLTPSQKIDRRALRDSAQAAWTARHREETR